MIGFVLEAVLGGLFDAVLARVARKRRVRGWRVAREGGGDVVFGGFVRGPVAYRPPVGDSGGVLVLSAGELFWTADPGLGRGLWHRVPTQRLVVQHRTHGTGSPGVVMWPGYECLDGDRTVVILCEPDAERYLRAALGLPELEGREPVTDAIVDPGFWAARGGSPPPDGHPGELP